VTRVVTTATQRIPGTAQSIRTVAATDADPDLGRSAEDPSTTSTPSTDSTDSCSRCAPRPASATSSAETPNPMVAMTNAGTMPAGVFRSTTWAASSAPTAIPTDDAVNCQAKTLRRSCDPTQRRMSTAWAGWAAVIPAPKTSIAARNAAGVDATSMAAVAAAATSLATTATRTGETRSASRPPSGAASSAPTENRLDAAAAAMVPQPRELAAYAYW